MDEFLKYLVKKSDMENNEFFAYRQREDMEKLRRYKTSRRTGNDNYTKIEEPSARDYVVLDFETTGLDANLNRIIEIGAVKVKNGRPEDKFTTLVDPEQYIPHYISTKVHITNVMVSGKPKIETVLPEFMDFAGTLPIVAHNAPFDMSFLLANAARLDIEVKNGVIDTLALSRKYNKQCQKHNLGYLTEFFGIELKNAHRAYFDAAATQKLYEIIHKKYTETMQGV
ncbi:MAG: 3'-5' exonuclease [Firmicutes bacterium]|nr:3'-5' exonuclease [Bacillota bacterium]